MPRLDSVALSNIHPTGFDVLASSPEREVRGAIATSPHTPIPVIDRLAEDRDPMVRRYALARTTNIAALTNATTPGREGLIASSAHSNPAAPVANLVAGLASKDRAVRLAAWCNPTTPLEPRLQLSASVATSITHVGGSLADQVVRAHALVLANPWMLDNPGRWDGNIRRALGAVYEASAEALQAILAAGSAGRSAAKAHPALNEDAGEQADLQVRVAAGSPAVDLELLADPVSDESIARLILQRTAPPPEPITIGHAVRRFGVRVLAGGRGDEHPVQHWSGTRLAAASWVAPVLGFMHQGFPQDVADIEAASAILGDSRPGWETFLSLLPSWHATAAEAAQVALHV